jgi:4-hydroxy-tetrahydrodipicolinate synthase
MNGPLHRFPTSAYRAGPDFRRGIILITALDVVWRVDDHVHARMVPAKIKGILAPVLTPFDQNTQVDVGRSVAHCKWLLENGCDGLVLFGTTSEANSLSVGERKRLAEQIVSAGLPPQKLILGTGCCSLTDSAELTKHAIELGSAGVLVLPPFYYKPVPDEGLFRYFGSLIDRISDARLRLYLYHIPPIAQVGFSLSLVNRLAGQYPGTIAGIKDSSGDWENTKALISTFRGQDFDVFPGSESYLLAALQIGATGCISATANVAAQSLQAVYQNWRTSGAKDLQESAGRVRMAFQQFPVIPGLKAALAKALNDELWKNVLPPLSPLSPADSEKLSVSLSEAGFAWLA